MHLPYESKNGSPVSAINHIHGLKEKKYMIISIEEEKVLTKPNNYDKNFLKNLFERASEQ